MRLKDGGFENPASGVWTVAGNSSGYDATNVHSGALAMELHSRRQVGGFGSVPTDGDLLQTVGLGHFGEHLALSGFFFKGSFATGTNLQLYADGVPIESLPLASLPSGWTPHIWPPVLMQSSSVLLGWKLSAPTVIGNSFLWLDDLALAGDEDVAKRRRWLAHQRLVEILKGINGPAGGYHTDLGNRVFTKYIRPVGSTHPPLPYICVPLVNTLPRVEHDNTWLRHRWTLPIMVFVAETNVGAYDSNAIAAIYDLGEDVYRAVMLDPTLNNTVEPVSFLSGGIEEGGISPFDGLPYADAVIPLDLSIFLGLDVLGP